MANARIREALTAGTNLKEKGTPTPDGVLTVTPDTPEVAEWRSKSVLDCVATTSSYLDEDDFDGIGPPLCLLNASACAAGRRSVLCMLRRQEAKRAVWKVHVEDRKLLRNQQTRAQEQSV